MTTAPQDHLNQNFMAVRHFRTIVVLASFSLLLLCCCGSLIAAPTTKPAAASTTKAAPKAAPQPGTTKAAVEVEIPLAAFNIPANPKEGKDPFFPNRSIHPTAPKTVPTNVKVAAPIALILNGLSGTSNRPLAIINNYTIAKNEEADIRAGSGPRVHVRCVDIKDDSVIIEVNGERQELRLRLGMR